MREAFALASGPSMTAADAEIVRRWREAAPDRSVVVANTTFRLAPWADALFAMDRRWWMAYAKELESFAGLRYCRHSISVVKDVTELRPPEFDDFQNSGTGAVALAILQGATKVYLLGYDCKRSGGKAHWHGDHPKGMTNAASIKRWPKFFDRLAHHAKHKGVRIVNCSRDTALTCFERATLESICVAGPADSLPVVGTAGGGTAYPATFSRTTGEGHTSPCGGAP